ncbi:MAG: hypothetical protein D6750_08260 [Bacteroidetes bacterium]|nr:MAG: hypothetical protein D6750_08260 [Bacteroidota bacterium]
MKKIAFVLVPLLGVALAKAEAPAEQKTHLTEITSLGPGKNYRTKLAQQYFGRGGGRCHKWNRFCGR